jgi:hypothetical protein
VLYVSLRLDGSGLHSGKVILTNKRKCMLNFFYFNRAVILATTHCRCIYCHLKNSQR